MTNEGFVLFVVCSCPSEKWTRITNTININKSQTSFKIMFSNNSLPKNLGWNICLPFSFPSFCLCLHLLITTAEARQRPCTKMNGNWKWIIIQNANTHIQSNPDISNHTQAKLLGKPDSGTSKQNGKIVQFHQALLSSPSGQVPDSVASSTTAKMNEWMIIVICKGKDLKACELPNFQPRNQKTRTGLINEAADEPSGNIFCFCLCVINVNPWFWSILAYANTTLSRSGPANSVQTNAMENGSNDHALTMTMMMMSLSLIKSSCVEAHSKSTGCSKKSCIQNNTILPFEKRFFWQIQILYRENRELSLFPFW